MKISAKSTETILTLSVHVHAPCSIVMNAQVERSLISEDDQL